LFHHTGFTCAHFKVYCNANSRSLLLFLSIRGGEWGVPLWICCVIDRDSIRKYTCACSEKPCGHAQWIM